MTKAQQLVREARDGNRRALARLITALEGGGPEALALLEALHPHAGNGYVIGVTGPPGSGKSTLVGRLIALYRAQGREVGVLAVDPTSPYTGGAVLGDRIRMQAHALDRGVFLRSLATRGASGGLPRVIGSAARALDAAGLSPVLIETAGVGQTELAVMDAADTIVVVLVPESGDAVQMLKAGLLEIADVFVVNKADREGAEALAADLEGVLGLVETDADWRPPILLTEALHNRGIDRVQKAVEEHRRVQERSSRLAERRRSRRRREFLDAVQDGLLALLESQCGREEVLSEALGSVERGETDPLVAAAALLRDGSLLMGQPVPEGEDAAPSGK